MHSPSDIKTDSEGFVKNGDTLQNRNKSALEAYRRSKAFNRRIINLEAEVLSLKEQIEELRSLMINKVSSDDG